MTTAEIEQRLAVLEQKMEILAAQGAPATNKDWVLKIWGSFAGDSDFEKAMRLGRQWRVAENRKSLRNGRNVRERKTRK